MKKSMHQYKAENAKPNPKSTINSYRSFGYNLSTAIADIIDNSILMEWPSKNMNEKYNLEALFISLTS